ncbi:hypothetical protein J437_LFUL000048 [Ladona fulva]|uniref:DEP domain-containing protein n=1 Tax=Ladona fulva TaxID=123851 RepID=A0A8K0JYX7_LADFU|nr:hypothetical protein J437_LFUL000048 [Ladona fulva]
MANSTESFMDTIPGDLAMDNLYPALIECFAVIICGYLAGRFNIISQTETKGLNTFVGTFSLPALIFLSMAELDLSVVNWMFLLSILVAKSIVFFAVVAVSLLVGRPTNFGRAGLFAIFCTQSNDFAIGYPIVSALYSKTHPEYSSYLYLVAPVSLVILNPLGFILMEIGKRKNSIEHVRESSRSATNHSTAKMAVAVIRSIVLNPVVLMTALGMLGNVIFSHKPPTYILGILKVMGSAFSGTALFLLGLRMVGKVHKLKGAALLLPGILIIIKLLALPLITREVVSLFHSGTNASDTLDLSTYGFLYGTFPSAPGVFVFSTQYSLDVDLIASSMVACTFVSAPLMFVSAKMITINKMDPSEYANELAFFSFDVAVAGILFSVWVLGVFVLSKKIYRMPHKVTFCLAFSQLLLCVGVVIWWSIPVTKPGDFLYWTTKLQFALVALGAYSSRLWTAFLAVTLLFLQCRSLCFVLKLQPLFICLGWGLPAVVVIILLLAGHLNVPENGQKWDPNFLYGEAQAIISVFFLTISFIVTIGSLVLQQRYRKRYARYLSLAQEISGSEHRNLGEPINAQRVPRNTNDDSDFENSGGQSNRRPKRVVDIEDLGGRSAKVFRRALSGQSRSLGNPEAVTSTEDNQDGHDFCSSEYGCPQDKRERCRQLVARHHRLSTCAEEDEDELIDNEIVDDISEGPEDNDLTSEAIIIRVEKNDPAQTLRHIVVLIMLCCSMFVGLSVCIWTLVMEQTSGIYVELAFLDASLNFGQSIFVFVAFGLDSHIIISSVIRRWQKWWYGEEAPKLLSWDNLSEETKEVCIRSNASATVTSGGSQDRGEFGCGSFKGTDLVTWLVEVGLAHDRAEGIRYGRHLLDGAVIRHVAGRYHFHDRPLLYHFSCLPPHPSMRTDSVRTDYDVNEAN